MTYRVFIQTKDFLQLGDEEYADEYHVFEYVDIPRLSDYGVIIYYGTETDPSFMYFIPHDQILHIDIVKE